MSASRLAGLRVRRSRVSSSRYSMLLEKEISSLSEEQATLKAEGMFLEKIGTSPEMLKGRVLDFLLCANSSRSSALEMDVRERGRVLDWARALLPSVSLLRTIVVQWYWAGYHHR